MTLAEKIKLSGEWLYKRGDQHIVVGLVLTRKEYEAATRPKRKRPSQFRDSER